VNIGAVNDQFTQFGNSFSLAISLGNVSGGLWEDWGSPLGGAPRLFIRYSAGGR